MTNYNAEISAGSLMPLESRRLAELLQTNPDETTWIQAVETDNILQKKTPATARRQARLIKRRLTHSRRKRGNLSPSAIPKSAFNCFSLPPSNTANFSVTFCLTFMRTVNVDWK
jgi:hypothetical protein